jgi:hypothetical protein
MDHPPGLEEKARINVRSYNTPPSSGMILIL